MGRPSLYTPELAAVICERIASGEPLARICRDEGMPAERTVHDWIEQDKDGISAVIAQARARGFDAIAAECLEIADDGRNDFMVKAAQGDEPASAAFNAEHVQRSKLRVETRLKLLAKWDPKRYGDKVDLTHRGSLKVLSATDLDDDELASIATGGSG